MIPGPARWQLTYKNVCFGLTAKPVDIHRDVLVMFPISTRKWVNKRCISIHTDSFISAFSFYLFSFVLKYTFVSLLLLISFTFSRYLSHNYAPIGSNCGFDSVRFRVHILIEQSAWRAILYLAKKLSFLWYRFCFFLWSQIPVQWILVLMTDLFRRISVLMSAWVMLVHNLRWSVSMDLSALEPRIRSNWLLIDSNESLETGFFRASRIFLWGWQGRSTLN